MCKYPTCTLQQNYKHIYIIVACQVGRAVGVAKEAAVVAVRVLDCDGAGTVSSVVAGARCLMWPWHSLPAALLCWQTLITLHSRRVTTSRWHVAWLACLKIGAIVPARACGHIGHSKARETVWDAVPAMQGAADGCPTSDWLHLLRWYHPVR